MNFNLFFSGLFATYFAIAYSWCLILIIDLFILTPGFLFLSMLTSFKNLLNTTEQKRYIKNLTLIFGLKDLVLTIPTIGATQIILNEMNIKFGTVEHLLAFIFAIVCLLGFTSNLGGLNITMDNKTDLIMLILIKHVAIISCSVLFYLLMLLFTIFSSLTGTRLIGNFIAWFIQIYEISGGLIYKSVSITLIPIGVLIVSFISGGFWACLNLYSNLFQSVKNIYLSPYSLYKIVKEIYEYGDLLVDPRSGAAVERSRELYKRGLDAAAIGDYKRAIYFYNLSIRQRPLDVELDLFFDLLNACLTLKRYKEAIQAYKGFVKQASSNNVLETYKSSERNRMEKIVRVIEKALKNWWWQNPKIIENYIKTEDEEE